VYEWLDLNYAERVLTIDPEEDKYDFVQKRDDYYNALHSVIADMFVYEIPDTLLAKLLDEFDSETVRDPEWKSWAYGHVL